MEPLKITFTLGSAISLPKHPLHLDALLAYVNTQKGLLTLEEPHSREQLLALADDLPFKRFGKGDDWVYMASALQPVGEMLHTSRFYTCRNDVEKLSSAIVRGQAKLKRDELPFPKLSHSGKLDFNRGHQRNALNYHSVTYVDKMVAYCVGDPELIEEALTSGYLTHLGKHHRMGFGFITGIDIKRDDAAKELWKNRVKPFESDGDVAISSPLRPPYWDLSTKTLCFMPSALV
jgi:CRISPR type IV-associated protein Csf3